MPSEIYPTATVFVEFIVMLEQMASREGCKVTDRLAVTYQLVPEAGEYLFEEGVESQILEHRPEQRESQFHEAWKAQVARTDFWLVRHGQTDWNLAGRWQGQAPSAPPLNDTGRAQALAVPEQLKGVQFSAIYSSDLLRSRQTAELIGACLHLPITLEPRLCEMNLGAWEGMLCEEIQADFSYELAQRERDPLHVRAPQGESPKDVADRVIPAVLEIAAKHPAQSVLIVAHGMPLALLACYAQGISIENVYENIPHNGEPLRLNWR